jgi:hypothetical protein
MKFEKIQIRNAEELTENPESLKRLLEVNQANYYLQEQKRKKEEGFNRLEGDSLECIYKMIDRLYTLIIPNTEGKLGVTPDSLLDDGSSETVSAELKYTRTVEIKARQMKEICHVDDICRFIFSKIANLYKLPPKREVVNKNGSVNEKYNLFYLDILDQNNFNELIREAEIQKEFLGDIECKIDYISRSKKWVISFIPSFLCDVVTNPDNPQEVIAKCIKQQFLNDSNVWEEYYEVWTKNNVFIFSNTWNLMLNPENPDNINVYGIIPIVTFRKKIPISNYYNCVDEEVLTTQQTVDKSNIELEWIKHFQSFPIPVLKNYKGEFELGFDPMIPLVLPPSGPNASEPDFSFVSPNAKIQELRNDINGIKQHIYFKKGIPPHEIEAISSGLSGKSLEILADQILEEWDKRKIPATMFENELFLTVQVMADNINIIKKTDGDYINIIYTKVRKSETQEQREKRLDSNLKLGLSNIYQIYAEENSVDIETAEKRVDENIKLRNRVNNEFLQ